MTRVSLALFSLGGLPPLFCPVANAYAIKGDMDAMAVVSQVSTSPADGALDDEIVVTADRYGEAKVAAESELGEDEIASHGSDSIQELLVRLAPLINSNGDQPVILINGKPAGFDQSILSYPTEALARMAVLKPEAAAQYGESPGRRVVNLVLKKRFSMLNADAGANMATAGGQYGASLSAGQTAIRGDTRWNVNARIGYDSALRKNARNTPPPAAMFDGVGYISAIDGGEIDPLLSGAAGALVTVAAIPPGAMFRAPTLLDFAATANDRNALDPDAYDDFQPARRNMSLNIGVTRPVGNFSVSLNLNASRSSSDALRGLPMASVVIPGGNVWTPFAGDVVLTRPYAGERALRAENDSQSLGGSLTVNGMVAGWQTSLGINYSRNWNDNLVETGVAVDRVQQLIDAGDAGFNPYGMWDSGLLRAVRNRSNGENLVGRFQVQKGVLTLPAGPLALNISLNASRGRFESRRNDNSGGPAAISVSKRQQVDGQISLAVPISQRGVAEIGPLGDIALDLTISGRTMANAPLQKQFGGGLNWSPFPIVQLRGSVDYVEVAPSFELLDGPIVTSIKRMFDYSRAEIVDPVWTMGGNPDLRGGTMQSLSLDANIRPFTSQLLTLSVGYRQSVAKGAISAFPELTPVIEAAFPDRVTRDSDGRLIAVDARAINLARENDAILTSGIALRLPGQGGAKAGKETATANPLQISASLNYNRRLKNDLRIRAGLPTIDRLTDSGQSRDNLSLQITVGKRGVGATLSGNWSSAAMVRSADRNFHFSPPKIFNITMFLEPDRLFGSGEKRGWINDLKLSFDVQNIFNGYRRVTLDDGSVPPGYTRDEVDPLGRVIRFAVRKRF